MRPRNPPPADRRFPVTHPTAASCATFPEPPPGRSAALYLRGGNHFLIRVRLLAGIIAAVRRRRGWGWQRGWRGSRGLLHTWRGHGVGFCCRGRKRDRQHKQRLLSSRRGTLTNRLGSSTCRAEEESTEMDVRDAGHYQTHQPAEAAAVPPGTPPRCQTSRCSRFLRSGFSKCFPLPSQAPRFSPGSGWERAQAVLLTS